MKVILEAVIEEIRSAWVEGVFTSNWELINTYHRVGKILEESVTMTKVKFIAAQTKISERNLYRASQFYRKYPDLSLLPEGKDVSWSKIVNKYLPEKTKERNVRLVKCPICGNEFRL